MAPLIVVENFPLTPLIKFKTLTNGNFQKPVNAVKERTSRS